MAELRPRDGDQPLPIRNGHRSVQDRFREYLAHREEVGVATYGDVLRPFNGRDALRDLLDELTDGALYVLQAIVERDTRPAPTLPCEKCGEADAVSAVVWGMSQNRVTFLACRPCEDQAVQAAPRFGYEVHTLPVYPPRPTAPPAGVDLADDEDPFTGEPAADSGEHALILRRAANILEGLAEAAAAEVDAPNYAAEVANGLGGPVGALAALLTPATAEQIVRSLRTAAAEIDAEETRLGRPLHGSNPVARRHVALVAAAVHVINAREDALQ